MMQPLTPRQRDALDFIREYIADNGVAPTVQELSEALKVSKVSAFELIGTLRRKGYISRTREARSIQLVPQPAEIEAMAECVAAHFAVNGSSLTAAILRDEMEYIRNGAKV